MYLAPGDTRETSLPQKLMLFDLVAGGHHGNYMQHLVETWVQQSLPGDLYLVVASNFSEKHPEVAQIVAQNSANVHLIPITTDEEQALKPIASFVQRTQRAFQEWQLLCQYAQKLQATHCLVMYFDTSQIPIATGVKAPCPFSGIYFRPTFHYDRFAHFTPTRRDRVQQWREKFTLSRVLHHPQLHTLFCLDPFAVKYFDRFRSPVHIVSLPDPVRVNFGDALNDNPPPESLRAELGIDGDRKLFLLLGGLADPRKGVTQLLDAIPHLPDSLCRQICFLLVGDLHPQEQELLQGRIQSFCASKPIQIVCRCGYVPDAAVYQYFQLTDFVLAPYQRHVGMSGILMQAAAAQKPVLSSNYGLMGELVQRYQLGLAVDATQPSAIAQGLTQFLTTPDQIGDRQQMKAFAERNSADRFAQVIFQALANPPIPSQPNPSNSTRLADRLGA